MSEQRKTVERIIDVWDQMIYAMDGEPLESFTNKLTELVDSIPQEYRSSLKWDIDAGEGTEIRLRYQVPETDAEMAARIERVARNENWQRERDMAELARLKAKYEP